MIAGDLPDIPEYMDVDTLKVHAPTAVVIVCGGRTYLDFNEPVASLRDAFMRISQNAKLSKYDIRLAEDVVKLPRPGYGNLLQLESDISQISELVLLFTESAGSLAELGIFVMDPDVSPRLMVVIDRFNFRQESFIRHGILEYLSEQYGEALVCVIDLEDHGVNAIESVKGIELPSFEEFIEGKIQERLKVRPEPTSFVRDRSGHLIKLMTGLIQNYAALTFDEIEVLLYCMGISEDPAKLRRLLGCAELFRWIKIEKRGIRTFYSAVAGRIALNFELAHGVAKVNRAKWRADVRQYWKENDADRFKCISAAVSGAV